MEPGRISTFASKLLKFPYWSVFQRKEIAYISLLNAYEENCPQKVNCDFLWAGKRISQKVESLWRWLRAELPSHGQVSPLRPHLHLHPHLRPPPRSGRRVNPRPASPAPVRSAALASCCGLCFCRSAFPLALPVSLLLDPPQQHT